MVYTLAQYENDCLQDFGYLPDLEQPDADLDSLAATPEGCDLEPMDNAFVLLWECFQTAEDARAKKASEAAWAARRVLA